MKSLDWLRFDAITEKYIERLPRLLRSRRWTENGRNEAVFAGVSLDLPPEIWCRNLVFYQDTVSVSAWNIVLKAPKTDNQKTRERNNIFGAKFRQNFEKSPFWKQ